LSLGCCIMQRAVPPDVPSRRRRRLRQLGKTQKMHTSFRPQVFRPHHKIKPGPQEMGSAFIMLMPAINVPK
jgi:hypothetical protein